MRGVGLSAPELDCCEDELRQRGDQNVTDPVCHLGLAADGNGGLPAPQQRALAGALAFRSATHVRSESVS